MISREFRCTNQMVHRTWISRIFFISLSAERLSLYHLLYVWKWRVLSSVEDDSLNEAEIGSAF